jgi:hypothetical protein
MRRLFGAFGISLLLIVGLLAPAAAHDHVDDKKKAKEPSEVTAEAIWKGDDRGDAKAIFTYKHEGEIRTAEEGASEMLPAGETVKVLDVDVKGLPRFCKADVTMPKPKSFTADGKGTPHTFTATIEVTCKKKPKPSDVTFVKAWTGDDPGDAVAKFKYRIDDGEPKWATDGETVSLKPGSTIKLLDEKVKGLPESCDATSDLEKQSFTADGKGTPHTFEVTNDVICVEVVELVTITFEKVWQIEVDEVVQGGACDELGAFGLTESGTLVTCTVLEGEDDPCWHPVEYEILANDEVVCDATGCTGVLELAPGDTYTVTETLPEGFVNVSGLGEFTAPEKDHTHVVVNEAEEVDEVEVAPIVIERELPVTGLDSWLLTLLGGTLLLAGTSTVAIGRRRG